MKLPIKKEYFDKIKSGDTNIDFRDSHITFVCEETGETLRKEVNRVFLTRKSHILDIDDSLFDDDVIIAFDLVDKPNIPLERDLKIKLNGINCRIMARETKCPKCKCMIDIVYCYNCGEEIEIYQIKNN